MRDVLERLMTWWDAGESVAVGTVVATFESAPRPPGAVMLVGPGLERRSAVCRAAASRARSTNSARRSSRRASRSCSGTASATSRRSQWDSPAAGSSTSSWSGSTGRRTRSSPRWRPTSPRGPSGGGGDCGRAPGSDAGRPTAGGQTGGSVDRRQSRVGAGRRRGGRRCARSAGERADGDVGVRAGRAAARRGDAGVRVVVRAGAAVAGVRGDRLRGGGRAARVVPRVSRDGLRRTGGLRDRFALPVRRRGDRRLAASLPVRRGRGRPDRRPDRDLCAHPRPEVRRTAAGGRAPSAQVAYIGAMGSRRTHDDRLEATPRSRSHRRRAGPVWPARSASTSAPAPRRRPPSASPPRSSPSTGAAAGDRLSRRAGRSTTDAGAVGLLWSRSQRSRIDRTAVADIWRRGDDPDHGRRSTEAASRTTWSRARCWCIICASNWERRAPWSAVTPATAAPAQCTWTGGA